VNKQAFIITVLILVCAAIYLFASSPPELAEKEVKTGKMVPIETVLAVIANENDVARSLYTEKIVGDGQKVGLHFDENWREPDVEAGPLPALFLRETAMSLEKSPIPLGLFLGSDFPITPSNEFGGIQADTFQKIKASRAPEYFYAEDTKLYTAMFPDLSSVMPCVKCHNEHAQSPKKDWELDDVMGATTWTYPTKEVSVGELIQIIAALRAGFKTAYIAYLEKAKTFSKPPEITDKWPRDGYYLPDVDTFLKEFAKRSSAGTVNGLIAIMN
jgi:adenylate cyclase